ncbi:MAG TPA: hypothetical protein VJT73_03985 [Polyangiaceae bacterium]|nr:hypothetical protein [Polyangiaceae bacterium]
MLKTRRSRVIVAVATFALALAYPVLGNAFLALGGVQKAFESTDSAKVDFDRAWTFWPGVVHVEGIRIWMQDRNVQFILEMPEADVTIRLRDLARRTFHATRVRGSNVRFRFRHRLGPESTSIPYVSAYPPIDGFEDPPLRVSGPPEAPLDEEHYNLWTVYIEDVDASVSEVWAQMFRYQGAGRVRGSFRLRPAKRLWVGPAELTLHHGMLTTGPHDLLRDVEASVDCKVDDFDTEKASGMDPFRFISARIKLSGQVSSLEGVNFLFEPSPAVRFEDGSGALDVDAAVDHGRITKNTKAAFRTHHLGVVTERAHGRADGELVAFAEGPATVSGLLLGVEIPRAAVTIGDNRYAAPDVSGFRASVGVSSPDVTEDWTLTGGEADVRRVEWDDLRWVNDLPLPSRKWIVDRGHAFAHGGASWKPEGTLFAKIDASIDRTRVGSGKIHWEGDAEIGGQLTMPARGGFEGHARAKTGRSEARFGDDRLVVSRAQGDLSFTSSNARAKADLFELRTNAGGVVTEFPKVLLESAVVYASPMPFGGTARVTASEFIMALDTARVVGGAIEADGAFSETFAMGNVHARDVRLTERGAGTCPWSEVTDLSLTGSVTTPKMGPASGKLDGTLAGATFRWGEFTADAAGARVAASWSEAALQGRFDARGLKLRNEGGAPKSWQAEMPLASMEAFMTKDGTELAGPVNLKVAQMTAKVGTTGVRGDVNANLRLISNDDGHRTADVIGKVTARRVALVSGPREITDWWADFDVHSIHIDARQNLDFRGKVQALFRDGLPALNVLASEEAIPRWVPRVLPLRRLSLDLDVERYCHFTDVQINEAGGGPIEAKGRLVLEPGETRGAVLVRLRAFPPIALGVSLVNDDTSTSAFAGSGWLERHLSVLTTAATAKHDARCVPQAPKCQ